MGDIADLTLEWAWEEDEEPRSRPTKKQLMRLIKSRHRRKLVKLQRFTDEDFYIAIGHQTLTWVWYELEDRRRAKPTWFGRRSR